MSGEDSPRYRLLTVSIRVSKRGDRSTHNLVTDKCPLRRVAESREKYPDDDMVLLSSTEIEDLELARWCLDKNGGELP